MSCSWILDGTWVTYHELYWHFNENLWQFFTIMSKDRMVSCKKQPPRLLWLMTFRDFTGSIYQRGNTSLPQAQSKSQNFTIAMWNLVKAYTERRSNNRCLQHAHNLLGRLSTMLQRIQLLSILKILTLLYKFRAQHSVNKASHILKTLHTVSQKPGKYVET